MNNQQRIKSDLPLIAILRGVKPAHILAVSNILVNAGFTRIEVPLNSPEALESISLLVAEYQQSLLIGAGTVTTPQLAKNVIDTGANLIVTPNFNEEVVKLAINANCKCYPGVVTPTECFSALTAGASGLKMFPIGLLGLSGFKAIKSVLSREVECYPVGGIDPNDSSMHPYLEAGATGFGLGSSLYKPSMEHSEIKKNAVDFITSYKRFVSLKDK